MKTEQSNAPSDLMTVGEVAEYLKVKPRYVYELLHGYDLPYYRLGRKTYRVSRAELANWKRARKEA